MATYNCERYVSESINSILNQTYKNFEFLIIDDCSKDKTALIVKELSLNDSRIKIFNNKKNIGLTKSLIKLTKFVKGDFIARIDGDDISFSNRFEEQIKWFKKNPKGILLGTSGIKIHEDGNKIKDLNIPPLNSSKIVKKLIFTNFYLHSSMMFKKIPFLKVGGYRKFFTFSQDYDLWCRMSKIGEIGNLAKNLIKIRSHEKSISFKKKNKQSVFALIASCLNYKDTLKLNRHNEQSFLKYIKNQKDLKTHFRSLRYLYSLNLPKKFKLNFFSLSFKEKIYLFSDFKFLCIKILKNNLNEF